MENLESERHILRVSTLVAMPIEAVLNRAECVAEATKRPLITLNCSDIGTNPSLVEKQLEYWFRLASTWGAILLIDEADVYMEQRTISDLERNVLVAGFLRRLEYYSGILFLTTNRVGTFDEAFMSRIDIPIYYPDLTDDQRLTIWHNFFRKLETEKEEEMRVAVPAKRFVEENPKLLALKWNAREIRNGEHTPLPSHDRTNYSLQLSRQPLHWPKSKRRRTRRISSLSQTSILRP